MGEWRTGDAPVFLQGLRHADRTLHGDLLEAQGAAALLDLPGPPGAAAPGAIPAKTGRPTVKAVTTATADVPKQRKDRDSSTPILWDFSLLLVA